MRFDTLQKRIPVLVAMAASISWGCGVLAGITDFTMVEPDGSPPPAGDAALPVDDAASASDVESTSDGPAPTDAGPDTRDAVPCTGPEVCGDGIDNDCNGKTDCTDPACSAAGFSCIDVPAGFTVVLFSASARGACPADYPNATPLHGDPAPSGLPGTGTCTCTCGTTTENPCVSGTLLTKFKENPSCGISGAVGLPTDGGCNALPPSMISSQCASGVCVAIATSPLAGKSVSCGPGTTTLPPLGTSNTNAQTCAATNVSAGAAGGCTPGAACAPPAAGQSRCVAQIGDVGCPGSYPTKTVLYVEGTEADGRTCGACACATSSVTCAGMKVTLFDDSACATPISTAVAGAGQCQMLSSEVDASTGFYQYGATPTPTPTCLPSPAQPSVQGTFNPGSPVTVCCP